MSDFRYSAQKQFEKRFGFASADELRRLQSIARGYRQPTESEEIEIGQHYDYFHPGGQRKN